MKESCSCGCTGNTCDDCGSDWRYAPSSFTDKPSPGAYFTHNCPGTTHADWEGHMAVRIQHGGTSCTADSYTLRKIGGNCALHIGDNSREIGGHEVSYRCSGSFEDSMYYNAPTFGCGSSINDGDTVTFKLMYEQTPSTPCSNAGTEVPLSEQP
jgi:hypothetical protein